MKIKDFYGWGVPLSFLSLSLIVFPINERGELDLVNGLSFLILQGFFLYRSFLLVKEFLNSKTPLPPNKP